MKKDAGILMPVLSLPNKYGCGDFGKVAYKFIDKIAACGFSIWQILPLQPLGYGASPYQPYSSKAMDELYISLDMLEEDGLLEKSGLNSFNENSLNIKYEEVRNYKTKLYKKAFENFKPTQEFEEFRKEKWVNNYAVYITFKKENSLKSWQEWPDDEKFFPENKEIDLEKYKKEIEYEIFIQYLLNKQWNRLRDYANLKGLKIMGDVPFYVGLDSEDVWWHKDMFLLDEEAKPTFIAGVPPDSFSATGQRWGNPIYNWERIEEDHFGFWIDRLHFASKLYDITRIDHFRAFSTYWKVPATCPTAMEGEWIEAPGYKFFDYLFEKYPDISIVAEDLGDYMDDVYVLRDHFNLKGMIITQQMFDKTDYGDTLSHQIVYTGTHDNDPIESWFYSKSPEQRFEYIEVLSDEGYRNMNISDAMVEYALSRKAETAVLPMCDILRLGSTARINAPGLMDNRNWSWRLTDFDTFNFELNRLKELLIKYQRSSQKED